MPEQRRAHGLPQEPSPSIGKCCAIACAGVALPELRQAARRDNELWTLAVGLGETGVKASVVSHRAAASEASSLPAISR